jgi:peroxiredoxin
MFTAAIAAKLSEGAEISCACFGPLSSDKMSGMTILRNIILLLWGVLVFAFEAKAQGANSPNQKKIVKPAALAKAVTLSAHHIFGKNLQRLLGFLVVFFLSIEVLLLSMQNSELKSRLAMLVGDGKNASLKPGEMVPPFKATGLDGKDIAITYGGKSAKTLLFIFSTACGACERNLANWSEIASNLKRGSYRVLGISLDPQDKTKNYVLAKDMNYPIFVSTDRTFKQSYKIFFTPQTILINEQGLVENMWAGVLDSLQAEEVISNLTKL